MDVLDHCCSCCCCRRRFVVIVAVAVAVASVALRALRCVLFSVFCFV